MSQYKDPVINKPISWNATTHSIHRTGIYTYTTYYIITIYYLLIYHNTSTSNQPGFHGMVFFQGFFDRCSVGISPLRCQLLHHRHHHHPGRMIPLSYRNPGDTKNTGEKKRIDFWGGWGVGMDAAFGFLFLGGGKAYFKGLGHIY